LTRRVPWLRWDWESVLAAMPVLLHFFGTRLHQASRRGQQRPFGIRKGWLPEKAAV
jgi:hypothetical protein